MTRSENMARIRGKDTGPEMMLRRALWARGLRYRLNVETPAGRPDIVFPAARVAVYVDGCQWHGCPAHYVRPRTRAEFWGPKLAGTVARDSRQTLVLEQAGWRVLRFWEHQVHEDLHALVDKVVLALSAPNWSPDRSQRVVSVEPMTADGSQERRFLQDLRDPQRVQEVQQARTTRKWRHR
jgi:DNA mismatch endonuclease (patch repair protein)